ncbi:MAG TPA: hypothetical protein VHM91_25975, partial [Verrucomicrobiales bacterium]|nr:hypothetical protein [Verrucomicrobiales bacterium]
VRFTRALPSGDGWVEGSALTATEFSQVVAGVSLMVNGTVVGSTGPADYEAATGNLAIDYNSVLGNLVPVTTGATVPLTLRLTATANAGSGSIQRFFVWLHYVAVETQDGRGMTESALFTPLAKASLVQVVPQYSALQLWRIGNFGSPNNSGAGANDADPDGDGNSNIVEYIMGQNPNSAAPGVADPRPLLLTTQGLNAHAFADLRLMTSYDSKVRLIVQTSTNLQNWQPLAVRDGTGTWNLTTPTATPLSGGRTRFVFDTGAVPASTPKFYVRLRAEEMP